MNEGWVHVFDVRLLERHFRPTSRCEFKVVRRTLLVVVLYFGLWGTYQKWWYWAGLGVCIRKDQTWLYWIWIGRMGFDQTWSGFFWRGLYQSLRLGGAPSSDCTGLAIIRWDDRNGSAMIEWYMQCSELYRHGLYKSLRVGRSAFVEFERVSHDEKGCDIISDQPWYSLVSQDLILWRCIASRPADWAVPVLWMRTC